MMSYQSNAMWARNAIAYTKRQLPQGGGAGAFLCVKMMRHGSKSTLRHRTMYDYVRSWAARARHFGCGNCAEHAAVAFVYLEDKKIVPIDYLGSVTDGDHAFIVIGRAHGSKKTDIKTWGSRAVVCDPYYDKVYPASQIPTRVKGGNRLSWVVGRER